MSLTLFVFVDGMTETDGEKTSLAEARTPNMDRMFESGEAGFYSPPVSSWDHEPRTDVVIPAFFGLSPSLNPGRAALELSDLGQPLQEETSCFFITFLAEDVSEPDAVIPLNQAKLTLRMQATARKFGAICQRSIAFNYGLRWLVGNCPTTQVQRLSAELSRTCAPLNVLTEDIHTVPANFLSVADTRQDVFFLGWAKGSLRGAFRHIGARCNPFNRAENVYLDLSALSANYDNYIKPALVRDDLSQSSLVLYTKETAFASRRGDRKGKIVAIEFMDRMLGLVLERIGGEMVVVVASDHSCNIGGTDNPPERTSFALARISGLLDVKSKSCEKFCEANIAKRCADGVITLDALNQRISAMRGGA